MCVCVCGGGGGLEIRGPICGSKGRGEKSGV